MSHRRFLLCLGAVVVAGIAWRYWLPGLDRLPVAELMKRGEALQKQNDHGGAIRYYTAALEKEPLNADVLVRRACSYVNLVQADRALMDLESALRVSHGKHRKCYLVRSFIFHVAGYYDEALADANRAIALDDTMADGYLMRSVVYLNPRKGDPARSKKDHEKAIALAPEFKDIDPSAAIIP
jgi:tetratricopeptide (TPR) repeat protein